MIRSLIVGLILSCSSFVTQAHVFHESECQALGYLTYQIANVRDQGVSKADVEDALFAQTKTALNDPDAFIIDEQDIKMVANLVEQLYENPAIAPIDAGKLVRDKCVTASYRNNT